MTVEQFHLADQWPVHQVHIEDHRLFRVAAADDEVVQMPGDQPKGWIAELLLEKAVDNLVLFGLQRRGGEILSVLGQGTLVSQQQIQGGAVEETLAF